MYNMCSPQSRKCFEEPLSAQKTIIDTSFTLTDVSFAKAQQQSSSRCETLLKVVLLFLMQFPLILSRLYILT